MLDRVLLAVADDNRRRMLRLVMDRELSSGEIAAHFAMTRPAVSQHLRVLKGAGLVTDRAEGTRRLYAVDPRGIKALRSWLDGFWDEALLAFKESAEREAAEEVKTMKTKKKKEMHAMLSF